MAAEGECQTAVSSDCERLSSLINKYVTVHADDGYYSGFVDAIDPQSKSIILSTNINDETKIILVIGSVIKEITPEEAPSECRQNITKDGVGDLSEEKLESRKCAVYDWLIRNLLPVQDENGVLKVHGGHLQILPPYRPEDCSSSNTIILGRIQHLLQNLPKGLSDDM